MARKKEMTLVAAAKPQLKKKAKRDWSKEKAKRFLVVLAETGNVSEACRVSGVPMTVAYRHRKMDAGFRASWDEHIAIGYQRLEAVLLERAFNGTERIVTKKDGSEERMREYPNQLGLMLLRMHRETAIEDDYQPQAQEIEEIRERLVRKLQRMKKRDAEQEQREAQGAGLRCDEPRAAHAGAGAGAAAAEGDLGPDSRTGAEI